MAKKKIGIYGALESTANNKVEDLYLVVDESAIAFSVKNHVSNTYQCFEYFVNDPENIGWNQLVAYLQNNSKLIQNTYSNIYFVMNNSSYTVTKNTRSRISYCIKMNFPYYMKFLQKRKCN